MRSIAVSTTPLLRALSELLLIERRGATTLQFYEYNTAIFFRISNGNISASLREIFDLQTTYHCLSYTWGPAEPNIQIACDGKSWQSRQNLYDALLRLYQVTPEKLSSIWIDAICIDQGNDTEKGFQLQRIHDIYAGADSVIAWLRPLLGIPNPSAFVSKFEDVARIVADSFLKTDGMAFHEKMLELNKLNSIDLKKFPLIKEIPIESWLAVRELVYNEYFRRQWIWQEVIASKSDPVVVCGAFVLSSWEALRKASHALVVFGDSILIHAEARMARPDYVAKGMPTVNLPHQLADIRERYHLYKQPYLRKQFGGIVLWQNRNSFMCWDERDRLFAMMGVCGYERLQDWDYSRPFKELYVHFWSDVMQRTKDINFLTLVEDAVARQNRPRMSKDPDGGFYDAELPSWVPDLRAPLEPMSMWAWYNTCDWLNISRGLPKSMEIAENESTYEMVVDEDRGRLKFHGYLLDTIQASAKSSAEILDLIRDILQDHSTEDDPHEGAIGAIWHSLACLSTIEVEIKDGITGDMVANSHLWLLHDKDFAPSGSMIEILEEKEPLEVERKKLVEKVQELDNKDLVFPPPGQTYRRLGVYATAGVAHGMKRMRLFRTRDHWIGKGPESLQVGDEVWVIPGAVVGFVLRPCHGPPGDGTHTLVGQAYIAGAMGGELSEEMAKKGSVEIILV